MKRHLNNSETVKGRMLAFILVPVFRKKSELSFSKWKNTWSNCPFCSEPNYRLVDLMSTKSIWLPGNVFHCGLVVYEYENHLTPWQCLPLGTCLRRASNLFCWSEFNDSVTDKIHNQKQSSKMVPVDVNDTQRNAECSSFRILNKVIFKSRDSVNNFLSWFFRCCSLVRN